MVIMQGVKASHLKGVVVTGLSNEEVLPNVSVILFPCPSGEFTGIQDAESVATKHFKTREDGSFEFTWPTGNRACLQFMMPNMNLLQMEVKRSMRAARLKVHLMPGT